MSGQSLHKTLGCIGAVSLAATLLFSLPALAGQGQQQYGGSSEEQYGSDYGRQQYDFDTGQQQYGKPYGQQDDDMGLQQYGRYDDQRYGRGFYGQHRYDRDYGEQQYDRGYYGQPQYYGRDVGPQQYDRGYNQPQSDLEYGRQEYDLEYDQQHYGRGYYGKEQYDHGYRQQYGRQYGEPYDYDTGREQYGRSGDEQYGRGYYGQDMYDEDVREYYGRDDDRQRFGRGDYGQERYGRDTRQQYGRDYDRQKYSRAYDERKQHGRDRARRLQEEKYGKRHYSPEAGRRSSKKMQGQWELKPGGMVRIGYDFDNDNRIDAYEWISYYELEKARKRSETEVRRGEQRSRYDAGEQMGSRPRGYYQEESDRTQRRMKQVRGTVKEMKTVSLAELDQAHILARVQTRDGRVAKVDLGPKKKIRRLGLGKGDQVTIHGTRGTINDRSVLMAYGVETGNQYVSIERPRDKNLKRYNGQIMDARSVSLGEGGSDVLMARVRLDDGNTTIINLGPKKDLQEKLSVKKGKDVSLLARSARIGGKRALVAESVQIGGKNLDVDWQREAKRQKGQN